MTRQLLSKTTIVVLTMLICAGAKSQSIVGLGKEEGSASLYRGNLPKTYPFRFNGTYYWSQKSFQYGSVFYNGKLYENVILNVDAYQGQLLVSPESDHVPIVVFRDQVAWFTMGDSKFLNLNYLGYADAPEGFYEIIRDGRVPILCQVTKSLLTNGNNNNGQMIGYNDPEYDPSIYSFFKYNPRYYALEAGQVVKLTRRKFKKMMRNDPGEPSLEPLHVEWHPTTESAQPGSLAAGSLPGTGIGLPSGYFEEEKEDTITVRYAENTVTASYKNKIYTIGSAGMSRPGKMSVSGIVTEYETDEPMYGVLVYDDLTSTYVRTDAKGRYRIQLPTGGNVLNFSMESKEPLSLKVNILSDGNLDVVLTEKVTMLKSAVVSAESMANHRTNSMGIERMGIKTLSKIPTAFGEGGCA